MKTNYTVRKMTLKPSTKEHIEKKLIKLDRFFSDEAEAFITLRLEKDCVTAELTIRDRSMVYRAEDSDSDATEAFNNAFDNIIRRIRKQKTRLEKRLRTTPAELPVSGEPVEEEQDFEIIRTKSFSVKPVSVQEAILQMNLVGHSFYMFLNEESNKINVVYIRNDGRYGLIEPD